MAELTGIKVKIGLRPNGHADHPDFNQLPCVKASGMDSGKYVDSPQYGDGLGWHYDKTCGHKEHSVDSPLGMQWGMLLMNQTFCEQACAAFPDTCSVMTEAECSAFYEEKCTSHMPDAKRDADSLNGRLAEISLLEKLISVEKDAGEKTKHETRLNACLSDCKKSLDPESKVPGVVKTPGKTWAEHKTRCGMSYKEMP